MRLCSGAGHNSNADWWSPPRVASFAGAALVRAGVRL